MRPQRQLMPPSPRAPAILAVVGLLVASTWLRADPPTPASLNLRAAGEARGLAERVITQHLDEAGRGSVEGVHRGFEAIRAWIPTRAGGEALTVEQVVQAFANGGGLTGEAGPYADALSRAVVEGARSVAGGGPLEGGLANLERAITDRVRAAANGFAGSHAGLIQSARWEVIFEALDTGFVPTTSLGPIATAFLRNLGVPAPASAAERMAAGLLAAQTGIVAADSVLAGGGATGPRPGDDPFNTITQLELGRPGARPSALGALPPAAFVRIPMGTKDSPPTSGPPPRPTKIDPFLVQMARERPATERVEVLITLRDDLRLPRFPEFQGERGGGDLVAMAVAPPDGTAAPSAAERSRAAEGLVAQIRAQRQPTYDRLRTAWTASFGVEVKKTFWLISGMLVEMPLGRVAALSEQPDVVFVEARFGNDVPPDANLANDVDDGRAKISSDPYFNAVSTPGSGVEFMALLDTGVRFTHQLLGPRILIRQDCTVDLVCDGATDPTDSSWNHGTSSAAILIGNDSMGAAYRGVTPFYLDSFKIYIPGQMDRPATVVAFQDAVSLANRVIVAEIQSAQGETGAIATAADRAFDLGAVVISANGNFGPGASTTMSPGSAHKVIGVGSVDVQTLAMPPSQSRGPTADGRIKPDLQAPTNTETASNASDSALRVFNGTSGATPYAAGAAALARKWMRGTNSIDPGQVYAFLIMAGQQFPFNNNSGAGLLVLPTNGVARWGKVSVAAGATVEIPITVAAGQQQVDAAIWWPEGETEAHDDIDLWLVDPAGTVVQRSLSVPSVFEKVRQRGTPLATGNWKIQIRGFGVASGPQDVYWVTHVKP